MRVVSLVPVMLLVLGGCATNVGGGADADAAQVHAFLRVDHAVETGGAVRTHASASFLRVHDGGDPLVIARLVGAAPTLPAEGGCTRLDGDDLGVPLRGLSPVELVQVDGVTLSSGNGTTALSARAYPDVAHLVSGVVYTSPDAEGAPTGTNVAFHVAGSSDVPTLDVTLDVPAPLEAVSVNGVALGGVTTPAPAAPLQVSWLATAGADIVYADFAVAGGSRWRCTADTHATALVGPAVAAPSGTRVTVTVHRLRIVPFAAGSLGSGEGRFDTAVTGTIAFDEPG